MKLSHLMEVCVPLQDTMPEDADIAGIRTRAQDVQPGELFIAVKGLSADGHDFIGTALENGAAAVLAEQDPVVGGDGRVIRVKDTRKATALAAARFYGNPSRDMVLIGVTGTNGKTTITYLLESILTAAGHRCGVIGTVNIRYPGFSSDNPITTPDAVVLQKSLADMKQAGVTHVVMEVSSHGLAQYRVEGCEFDAGIYTNLTQDHLDYHGDMADYFNCKKRFFTDFLGANGKTGSAPAVINLDDAYGRKLANDLDYGTIGVSHSRGMSPGREADIRAEEIIDTIQGLSGTICLGENRIPLNSPLTGRFNLENILCAAGAAHAVGITPEQIRDGLGACTGVPGRLEKVANTLNRYLFVDYAHTPDALESILETLKERAPKRLISVFGCGGDRDRTKRPLMGRIACTWSDIAIATSDNPRSEDPERIVDDIIPGIAETGVKELTPDTAVSAGKGFLRQTDRRRAIRLAVEISRPGDIIVAAGKGHEDYQITNAGKIHFDDKEELADACTAFEKRFTPIPWRLADLEEALGTGPVGTPLDPELVFSGVSTDSRSIQGDDVFVALAGENFDAHNFIPSVLEKGIRAFVVRKGFTETLDTDPGAAFFEVDDTLAGLGLLGQYQRMRSGVKVAAITGSNGKTTTRKMTRNIFEKQFHTLATQGNFNNEIGVPLTLLKLSAAHEWAVIEMGMNHLGEMSRLSAIARPNIAVVTNTAGAHLEGLKTPENVAHAKAEIFESVGQGGTAVIFGDDPRVSILAEQAKANFHIKYLTFFGQADTNQVRAEAVRTTGSGARFTARMGMDLLEITLHSPARFMVNNALAAVAAARAAGISGPDIQAGLAAFSPVSGRMDIATLANGWHLIDDTYNANPASVAQALATLAGQAGPGSKTIAVLGDMLELGEASGRLHWETGKKAADLSIDYLYLSGPQSLQTRAGAIENGMAEDRVRHLDKPAIAGQILKIAAPGDWILVKGSRGMAMETVINTWKEAL